MFFAENPQMPAGLNIALIGGFLAWARGNEWAGACLTSAFPPLLSAYS